MSELDGARLVKTGIAEREVVSILLLERIAAATERIAAALERSAAADERAANPLEALAAAMATVEREQQAEAQQAKAAGAAFIVHRGPGSGPDPTYIDPKEAKPALAAEFPPTLRRPPDPPAPRREDLPDSEAWRTR